MTICCEANFKPSGWSENWTSKDCHVVWICKFNNVAEDGYIYEIINGIKYGLNDGNAFVAAQSTDIKGSVNIPEKVSFENMEYPVSDISEYAFYDCANLESFTMPDSVTELSNYMFRNCYSLKNVTLHDQVQSIGFGTFENCYSLESIVIPESVYLISTRAFYGCYGIVIYCEAADVPDGWSDYWNSDCPYVLDCNNNDKDKDGYFYVTLDDFTYALKDGEAILASCRKDASGIVEIPERVEYDGIAYKVSQIKSYAFFGCAAVESVIIPDSVTSIGSYVFIACNSIKSVTIGSGVKSIMEYVFAYIDSLESVTFMNMQGWYVVKDDGSKVMIPSDDLEDRTVAASYLNYIYYYYSWVKD